MPFKAISNSFRFLKLSNNSAWGEDTHEGYSEHTPPTHTTSTDLIVLEFLIALSLMTAWSWGMTNKESIHTSCHLIPPETHKLGKVQCTYVRACIHIHTMTTPSFAKSKCLQKSLCNLVMLLYIRTYVCTNICTYSRYICTQVEMTHIMYIQTHTHVQ